MKCKLIFSLFSKTDLFGICCVFTSIPDCQGPMEFAYSNCDAFLNNKGLTVAIWLVIFSILPSNILFLTARFLTYSVENSKALLTLVVNLSMSYVIGAFGLLIIASANAHLSDKDDFLVNYYDEWVDSAGCCLAGVFSTASSQSSIFLMFLIGCERFASIVVTPNADARWRIAIYVALPIVWVLSFVLASVPLVADNYFEELYYSWSSLCLPYYAKTSMSGEGWQYSFVLFFVVDILTLIATFCLYVTLLVKSVDFTREQETDVLSRRFEYDKMKSILPAAVVDGICWLPLIFLCLLGPTGSKIHIIAFNTTLFRFGMNEMLAAQLSIVFLGSLVPISGLAWISFVAHQFRGILTPLALIYWTRMKKPTLSHRASTRRAQAIKKIRCMSIPNVEAGFVQIAHQAMIRNGK